MLFGLLRAIERYDAKTLPPPHRLVLVVLADMADERAQLRLSADAVKVVARRTGLGERQVRTRVKELEAALWLERDGKGGHTVRLEGGRVVPRRDDEPSDSQAPAIAPEPVSLTTRALMKPHPAKDLLGVLQRGAEEGHEWCKNTLERVMMRGGRVTELERRTLVAMNQERLEPRGAQRRRYRGASTLQSGSTWKAKGAPP